jgi:hypothetical protein
LPHNCIDCGKTTMTKKIKHEKIVLAARVGACGLLVTGDYPDAPAARRVMGITNLAHMIIHEMAFAVARF